MSKPLTKQFIIVFLLSHFRYNTMNSWNQSRSYAARVKIHDFVPKELMGTAFNLLETREPYDEINDLLLDFAIKHNYDYQVGFNGRSGGYLVLYVGGKKDGRSYTQPGVGIDAEEFKGDKFKGYSFVQLKDRYRLIQEFDALVESCRSVFLDYCKNFEVVEETIKVDKKIKVLRPLNHANNENLCDSRR